MPETDATWTCDLCGGIVPPGDGPQGVGLEVSGAGPEGEWAYWDVWFCSQQHAAEWLGRPLPPPPSPDGASPSTTWGDRAAATGCVLLVLWVLALTLVGAWTVVRFLLH
ncbi:hypothetical protein DQ237_13390 [Blastococcus sp. TF02-8]|uniref:hypothetical protein n=1 Tax=Blastococcus sp. TF02-8 TaxID=2250574 RepID=UPI000E00CDD3|nr:hypothetical protein [Blastococcus sp. TF02-8]RBY95521.1 hypothetical protein DQ237_13390 [Blastococcus sp. TF02-8]